MSEVQILCGDALATLKTLDDESVSACVTSPPFYGLRDYGTAQWVGGSQGCTHRREQLPRQSRPAGRLGMKRRADGGADKDTVDHAELSRSSYRDVCGLCGAKRVDQQIGLETTPAEYVERLVEVFREVRRVLRSDGTVWLNLGSSYASGKIESEEYVIRDDLTLEEQAYVYAELAKHFEAQSAALSQMPATDAPAEHGMSFVLPGASGAPASLSDEGV